MQKRVFLCLILALVLLMAAACNEASKQIDPTAPPEATPQPTQAPTPAPQYIWTISVDGVKSQSYGEGQLTANYTVHLSASKEGGDAPEGDYRGEIRVEYEGVPDAATLYAIGMLKGTDDFVGWGESDSFAFAMEPYNHNKIMDFVANAYQGEGPKTAPLLEGIAMCTIEDIPWTQKDWSMGIDAGLDGILGIDAYGDDMGGFSMVQTPFGGSSASAEGPVPLRCSIQFLDESRVQFNIWSHGDIDVDLSFSGTLDKVLLSDTIAVG